ncbi:MAG TPA: DUF4118 domain-containing protein [Pseudolabrys sp.]|nr:DUF4118 domain-containing protein [Pseudolabrys sp.]
MPPPRPLPLWRQLVAAAVLLGATMIPTYLLVSLTGLRRGSVIFVIPVVIAAARWGMIPAIATAFASVAASIFFFYPPLYTFRFPQTQELINLAIFLFVAVFTAHLAARLREQADLAQQRALETHNLYAFSRRLAAAFTTSDIHAAIEDYLANVMQHDVVLFAAVRDPASSVLQRAAPDAVRTAVRQMIATSPKEMTGSMVTDDTGGVWLVRPISEKTAEFGIVAINFEKQTPVQLGQRRAHIEYILADARATLERLDIASAIHDARLRSQTEQLFEALIGSVSHELRTPLASILGAATVLSTAPAIMREKKLHALADDVRDEARRLDHDIQNLLDATRISSDGIRPRSEWTELADIINAAMERCRGRLNGRQISIDVPADLPLVFVDAALIRQALVHVIDNAAKYSPPDAPIGIGAAVADGQVALKINDRGIGLTPEEKGRMWDRFFRGERTGTTVNGSGLGLWIARAFVAANDGCIDATSEGVGMGTVFSIRLPVRQAAAVHLAGETDE